MFGLESERRVQRRYNLLETTLQQIELWGMVHTNMFVFKNTFVHLYCHLINDFFVLIFQSSFRLDFTWASVRLLE